MTKQNQITFEFGEIDKGSQYMENALELLLSVQEAMNTIDGALRNKEELKKISLEFEWLRKLEQGSLEYAKQNPEKALKAVKTALNSVLANQIELDIDNSKLNEELKYLILLSNAIKDRLKIKANIDIFINESDKIKNKPLREQVVRRLLLLKRFFGKSNSLRVIVYDLTNWERYVHFSMAFFSGRVKQYFTGKPPLNIECKGLDELNEEEFKQRILASNEIRALMQSGRLAELIEDLRKDFDDGKWNRTEHISKFVDNLPSIIDEFEKVYLSRELAQMFRQNAALRQQPFEWIRLMESAMPEKATVIENAKEFLSRRVSERQQQVEKAIGDIIAQLSAIVGENLIPRQQAERLGSLFNEAENSLWRKWEVRQNEFMKIYKKIDPLLDKVIENKEVSERTWIRKDMDRLMKKVGELGDFMDGTRISPNRATSYNDWQDYFLTMDINFAGAGTTIPELANAERNIGEKNRDFWKNIGPLQKILAEILQIIEEFNKWIESARINTAVQTISDFRQQLNAFRGDHNGR